MKKTIVATLMLPVLTLVLISMNWHRDCDYPMDLGQAELAKTGIQGLVVFAFGNRINEDGSLLPGPINGALSEATLALYRQLQVPVYAQWEVSELVEGAIPEQDLFGLYPVSQPGRGEVYLSTAGVIDQVTRLSGGPGNLQRVYVVAHEDHLCRCIEYLRARGYQAYASPLAMPDDYDTLSGQPWTRYGVIYRLVDSIAALFS